MINNEACIEKKKRKETSIMSSNSYMRIDCYSKVDEILGFDTLEELSEVNEGETASE